MATSRLHDTSDELLIQPYRNGVRLIRPNQPGNELNHFISVSQMMALPMNVYFTNVDSVIQNFNELTTKMTGFVSLKDAIGSTIRRVANKKTVTFVMNHEREVMKKQRLIILDEYYQRLKDEEAYTVIPFKFPWYNDEDKLIGVFGCSIVLNPQTTCSVAEALIYLSKAGLLNPVVEHPNAKASILPGLQADNKYFTQYEKEILQLVIAKKSNKEIAAYFDVSSQEVALNLQLLKTKFGVNSKTALIEKIITLFDEK